VCVCVCVCVCLCVYVCRYVRCHHPCIDSFVCVAQHIHTCDMHFIHIRTTVVGRRPPPLYGQRAAVSGWRRELVCLWGGYDE